IVTVAALGYSTTPRYFLILDIVCLVPMTLHFAYISATYRDTYYLALLIVSLTWQGVVIKKGLHASATAIAGIASNERLQDEIAEHTKTKAQIQHIAMHDPLTGLANRRHFEETSERMLKAAERRAIALGIVMIDLDDFKPINDNYGHAVGDAVLQAIARRLQDNLRASDFVARIGGDEFTLIIENLETPGALSEVVQKFSLSLNSPLTVGETSLNIGASLGHAAYPQDGSTLDELMRIADQRMYAQKATHKAAIAR
ncbi:MAG TPA: GGDEF domain-containing protein, partial [Azospira sp.]|nr:GGDEF domain-containing protein [Azospira sp.]HNN46021.1 GGDEF domain-containing protein [Azospira sp.]